jgi:hypothetical protein
MPEPTSLLDVQPIQANGTVLHTETRGHGPAVLLIAGAGGDAAELGGLADALADAFTVTTYDRRGNSRCPRPAGWTQTRWPSRPTTPPRCWPPSAIRPPWWSAPAPVAASPWSWRCATPGDRWLGNGEVFFGVEMASIMAYAPTVEAIAHAQVRIVAAASSASRDPGSPHHFLYQAAAWLASQVDAALVEVPGGHMAYLTDPAAVAEGLRPLLRQLS